MDNFLRIYLVFYVVFYFLCAFVFPTYTTWKKTGLNPIVFGKEDNAHHYIGFVMKILIVLLFAAIVCYAAGHQVYNYLIPIHYLQNHWLQLVGLVLIHLALVWIAVAQYQMNTSWRIGIDEKNSTYLKTKGIFGVSRNPVFLGMLVTVLGIFFILPDALTFCLVLTIYFIIQIQIRLEEEFLTKQHPADYLLYKKSVRRFL